MSDPIYLDHNATTPVAPEVIEAMAPALRDAWGNPSSAHAYGRRARAALDTAREQVAQLLGCAPAEVVFTSGGTESDNMAILGLAEARRAHGLHLVTTVIEHPAVERACVRLEQQGYEVSRVRVTRDGSVDPTELAAAIREDTTLLTLMHANNETGVIQPVREIADAARARGVTVHTDAAQSVGKVPVVVSDLGVDLLTVAGHKLYGPKGVGALYVRRGTPLVPLLHGAGHEDGRRAGTENTPEIVGLGAACALAAREIDSRVVDLRELRDRLELALCRAIPDLVVHGSGAERLPNTLSAAVPGVDANRLLERLSGVAAAAGAACHAGATAPSTVLRAMGVPDDLALATLRLSVGRSNTAEQIDAAVAEIRRQVSHLKRS
jgi:cysteine desulfurase